MCKSEGKKLSIGKCSLSELKVPCKKFKQFGAKKLIIIITITKPPGKIQQKTVLLSALQLQIAECRCFLVFTKISVQFSNLTQGHFSTYLPTYICVSGQKSCFVKSNIYM